MYFRAILDNQSYVRLNLGLLFWCHLCESVEILTATMVFQKMAVHNWTVLQYKPSVQFSSVQSLSCVRLFATLWITVCLPVHQQLLEFTQTHVHRVSDAIQPSLLSSPSPPAPNPSQHQSLFQWVNSWHEVAKVLEFQLQHQSFQWTPRTDL